MEIKLAIFCDDIAQGSAERYGGAVAPTPDSSLLTVTNYKYDPTIFFCLSIQHKSENEKKEDQQT